jgi:hypothetical protein
MCPRKNESPRPLVESSELLTVSKELELPASLKRLVNGLRAGRGTTSLLSPSTRGGARPDLVPIVVSLSHRDGFSHFLTTLASLSALKEEGTGETILTHSYNLDAGMLMSLVESCRSVGNSAEITFAISMRAPAPDGTFRNTS